MLKLGTRVMIREQLVSQTHLSEFQKYYRKVAYIIGLRRVGQYGTVWYELDITKDRFEFDETELININKGL